MSVDLVVRGGAVVDGTGAAARRADVAVAGDRIAAVGDLPALGCPELDARGCAVAPGFVNVLSHAYESLQQDPRGLSDLYQGVTTEIFGEGLSLGPVTGRMTGLVARRGDGVRTSWPRLGEALDDLAKAGVGPNIGSLVGADNLRMAYAGADDRPLTAAELAAACELLDEELSGGALGVGSALIYAPGSYASTAELIAYARVAAGHDALYTSHIRGESDRLPDAVDELIEIAREASCRAEIYHLKATGERNWPALGDVLDRVEAARADGVEVTADVYPYTAGATFLSAFVPPGFHAGGTKALVARIWDAGTRAAIRSAVLSRADDWENLYLDAGGADGVLLLGGGDPAHSGRTLAEVAETRGDLDPVDTLLDLVAAHPDQFAAEFCATEANVHRALQHPWVSVCSDSEAAAAEPPFNRTSTHPRAYGAFARVLGPYVHAGVLTLEDAVRRMTGLPAANLRLPDRGVVRAGAFADLAVFVPDEVRDNATYLDPHRYASGMRHVLVNGRVAFRDGAPTGTLAGRALRRRP